MVMEDVLELSYVGVSNAQKVSVRVIHVYLRIEYLTEGPA